MKKTILDVKDKLNWGRTQERGRPRGRYEHVCEVSITLVHVVTLDLEERHGRERTERAGR